LPDDKSVPPGAVTFTMAVRTARRPVIGDASNDRLRTFLGHEAVEADHDILEPSIARTLNYLSTSRRAVAERRPR